MGESIDRREFILGATAGVATAALAGAAGADSHGHAGSEAATGHATGVGPKTARLRETTLECQETAADCVRHCVAALGAGDRSLARCLESVLRMRAITSATHSIVGSDLGATERTRALAAVCADFCRECAEECEPHAEKHAECQACLEACRRCIEACEAYAA